MEWIIVTSRLGVLMGLDEDENPRWSTTARHGDKALTFGDESCVRRLIDGLPDDVISKLPEMRLLRVTPDIAGGFSEAACRELGVW